jgi:hypothetical protein
MIYASVSQLGMTNVQQYPANMLEFSVSCYHLSTVVMSR